MAPCLPTFLPQQAARTAHHTLQRLEFAVYNVSMPLPSPCGIFNINKPAGITSRKVVDRISKLVRPAKAGHAGTLDPLATGVLVVCVGPATRLVPFIQDRPKTYRARFLLGRTSNTDDVDGEVTPSAVSGEDVTRERIESLLPRFVGTIQQVPPQYSAVHVKGQRAYKRARRGEAVDLPARTVEVYRLELLSFDFPEVELEIECGSGTYVRSIGRDLGERLGCGAVMSGLVRSRIGPFSLETAVELDVLGEGRMGAARLLLPAAMAVGHLPQYRLSVAELEAIAHGRGIVSRCPSPPTPLRVGEGRNERTNGGTSHPTEETLVALLTPEGELAAVSQYRPADGMLLPRQVLFRAEVPLANPHRG